MATQAHCAFCFETLSSTLSKTPSLTLPEVISSWNQWNNGNPLADDIPETEDPEFEDTIPIDPSGPPNPAISRLISPSPAASSSSSLPSVASSASRASEASSATSKSSSRSSFFGAGKPNDATEVEEHPLFVTWNTVHRDGERRLRGCIGTFGKMELEEGLASYALTSALEDTRFPPIPNSLLPTLEVAVTLLTNFQPISTPLDWTIGTHGLRISFTHHGRRYGSTYLPDVAKEQGWTKEETMVSLMRKAGWNGRRDEWRSVGLGVVRYQGRQVRLGYGEWRAWRDWVQGGEK